MSALRRAAALAVAAIIVAGCASPPPRDRGPKVSFETECAQRLPPGKVSVRTVPVRPALDESRSYHDLTRMAGEDGRRWVLGLTKPTLRVEARWGFAGFTDRRSGRTCVRPSLQMTLRYEPVVVFVGREFLDDTCAYEFIRAHEERHVEVHVRKLDEVARQMQQELHARLAGVTHVGTRDDLERQLKAEVRDEWIPKAEAALQDVKREHAAIDTPEEYARSRTVCDGRIGRYLPRRVAAD